MVNIAPVVAAVSAATATMNATNTMRMMRDPAYRKSIMASQIRDAEERIMEKEDVLMHHFNKAKEQIIDKIDDSKIEVNEVSNSFEYKYFDKSGNLLMVESGWQGIVDREVTTEIYSPETGEKTFSNCQYSGGSDGFSNTKHYTKGVCDNDKFLARCAKEAKKRELEAKREKHREKRKAQQRLLRIKTKKFFRDTFSRQR